MADHHHAALEAQQQLLQPADRIEVEVVGRLIEQQHIGLADQGARQGHPLLESARQLADPGRAIELQLVQRLFDPLLPVPGIERLDLVLQRVEVDPRRMLQIQVAYQFGARQSFARDIEHARIAIQHRFLRHIGLAQAVLRLDHAIVGPLEARQYLEQRRLAGAVAAHETDALLRFEGEVLVIQQGHMPERQRYLIESDQSHASDYPPDPSPAPAGCSCPAARIFVLRLENVVRLV